jgi:hypothetical protein
MQPVQNLWHLVRKEHTISMDRVASQNGMTLLGNPLLNVLQNFLLDMIEVVWRFYACLCQT